MEISSISVKDCLSCGGTHSFYGSSDFALIAVPRENQMVALRLFFRCPVTKRDVGSDMYRYPYSPR